MRDINPAVTQFDCSCFDGRYITGDVSPEYLQSVEQARGLAVRSSGEDDGQLDLNLTPGD